MWPRKDCLRTNAGSMAWRAGWAPPPRVGHDWTKNCQGEPLPLPLPLPVALGLWIIMTSFFSYFVEGILLWYHLLNDCGSWLLLQSDRRSAYKSTDLLWHWGSDLERTIASGEEKHLKSQNSWLHASRFWVRNVMKVTNVFDILPQWRSFLDPNRDW